MPYRSSPSTARVQRPRDSGIVGDIIDQFADPFAFYRELIQNGIDAGSEAIEVSIHYDQGKKSIIVSVIDRGVGMPVEVIEDRLLVLFRSTKEDDDSKIGKFGVGFVSVLAVNPSVVRVSSSHEGSRHTLHLYPDLSYELFDSGRASRTGTRVDLEIPTEPGKVEDFALASWDALNRWCRHATVMITLEAAGPNGSMLLQERVDRPLRLDDALVSVQQTTRDGLTAVVGLTEDLYCAFFNHGLLLYETGEPLAGQFSFVIQDARLGHTLSRDNVRRDKHYDRSLRFAVELGAKGLRSEIVRAMHESLADNDLERYLTLAIRVHEADIEIAPEDWPLPITDDIAERRMTDAARCKRDGSWVADAPSALSAALAKAEVPVVRRDLVMPGGDSWWFKELCGTTRLVDEHLTLVTPIVCSGADLVLLDVLSRVLEHSYRRPSSIVLAHFEGACGNELTVSGGAKQGYIGEDPSKPWVLDLEQAHRNPFRRVQGLRPAPALVLNADSPWLQTARNQAQVNPDLAAEVLARLLLLERDKLDEGLSSAMLSRGFDRLLRGRS